MGSRRLIAGMSRKEDKTMFQAIVFILVSNIIIYIVCYRWESEDKKQLTKKLEAARTDKLNALREVNSQISYVEKECIEAVSKYKTRYEDNNTAHRTEVAKFKELLHVALMRETHTKVVQDGKSMDIIDVNKRDTGITYTISKGVSDGEG